VWTRWRLDETYIKVKGAWKYLYRAVATYGKTIDFLLTEHRDEDAAKRFLTKALRRHGGVPETMTIDGSAANEAALKSYNEEQGTTIVIRQAKYLKNIVEQDHRAIKRVTRPMLGFKAFDAAQATLAGIELMHMMKKKRLRVGAADEGRSAAELFYAIAASALHRQGQPVPSCPPEQNLRQNRSWRSHALRWRSSCRRRPLGARSCHERSNGPTKSCTLAGYGARMGTAVSSAAAVSKTGSACGKRAGALS
jgi:transposase-like protein